MAQRRNVHRSGLSPLTPPDQMGRNIKGRPSESRKNTLPPARMNPSRKPPRKEAPKDTRRTPLPKSVGVPKKKPSGVSIKDISRGKELRNRGVVTTNTPQGSSSSQPQRASQPYRKAPIPKPAKSAVSKVDTPASAPRRTTGAPQGTQGAHTPPATPMQAERNQGVKNTGGVQPKPDRHTDTTEPTSSVGGRPPANAQDPQVGGANPDDNSVADKKPHSHRKESSLKSKLFGGVKKSEAAAPAADANTTPQKGSAHHAEDKKKSKVKRDRKGNVIDTNYDPKHYEEKFSTDDIDEAKEKAHLSDQDVKNIYSKVTEDAISQQVRSNGKSVQPLPKIVVIQPRKRKVFKFLTSFWAVLLVITATVLGGYGYKVWTDSEMSKVEDDAYALGVSSSGVQPDISSVMKMDSAGLQSLITTAQGVNLPPNPVLSNYSLAGWNIPGGNNKEGKTEVSFCYMGDGIQGSLKGSAFFFTPDAQSTNPQWTVDTVALTRVPCGQDS